MMSAIYWQKCSFSKTCICSSLDPPKKYRVFFRRSQGSFRVVESASHKRRVLVLDKEGYLLQRSFNSVQVKICISVTRSFQIKDDKFLHTHQFKLNFLFSIQSYHQWSLSLLLTWFFGRGDGSKSWASWVKWIWWKQYKYSKESDKE